MQEIRVDKVTVNIGIGSPGERLDLAKELLRRLSNSTPCETTAKRREPVFKLRPGLPIGTKVTLRGAKALEFLDKALIARKRIIPSRSFDARGNFSFGVPEYIDFPGAKYDPKIGMVGFDVCVTLVRPGKRVEMRRTMKSKIGKRHYITKDAARAFAKEKLNVKLLEE